MFYGNWCGPYWTAGQVKSTSQITQEDLSVPALNELDEVCKQHDLNLFRATNERDVRRANKLFQRAAASLGVTGRIFSWLVGRFGPNVPDFSEREILMLPPVANLPATTQMPTKRQIDFELDPRGEGIESNSKRVRDGTPDTVPRMNPVVRFDRPIIDRSDSFDMEVGQVFSEAVRNPTSSTLTTTNSTVERVGTSSATTAGRGHHGETNVDFKVTRYNPVDKTQQVIMPYVKKGTISYAENATTAQKLCFRLNSVFDIFSATDQGAVIDKGENPVSDPMDAQNNREVPAFREFWKKLYHYWHVVECKWKFHYRHNAPREHFAPGNATFYFYEHGMQNPPDTAVVNGVNQLIPYYIRKHHPHCRFARVKPWNGNRYLADATITSDTHCDEVWEVTEGMFKPGMIAHEVVEDEFNQVWHKWGEVPPTAEKLTIMLQPGDRDLDPATFKLQQSFTIQYYMEMEFVVQMKDRIFAFEFINQGSDFPATADVINIPAPA